VTLDGLRATPGILRSLVAIGRPEQLVWKPTRERWSICEILNHLTDVEKLNVGLRVRRMLEENLPSFEDYDPAVRFEQGRGRHPEVGEITIRQVLSLWSFHDLSHIRQISEILKAVCFWDDIGSLQKYYAINP